MKENHTEKSVRLIKKYPNRRLYDTTLGTYITLEEIKEMVLEHIEFKIIDAKTKKDITQLTLLQIITDQETTKPIFTTTLLQNFIRFYHEKSQSMLSQYLEHAMQLFLTQKEFLKNQWGAYQDLLTPSHDVSLKKKKPPRKKT